MFEHGMQVMVMNNAQFSTPRSPLVFMIEDDLSMRELNRRTLTRRGMNTLCAETLAEARSLLREPFDLVLLDLILPDGSGLDFVPEIRAVTAAPILILTSKREEEDIVKGLLGGGDDYMTKPFRNEELYARVVALLRRVQMAETRGREPRKFGRVTMDLAAGRAYWDKRDMLLKPKEYALLWELLAHRGEYVTGETLYEKLWGAPAMGDDHTVRNHIYQLRKKMGDAGCALTIEQEKNKGYRLAME